MSKQNKTAGKTATKNKSRIERDIMNALEQAREIVIRREDTPADTKQKKTNMLSALDRLHKLAQLYRGSTSFTHNDIIYTDGDDRVTIEITGKAFANLKEITELTSKWSEDDYTLSDILRVFCFTDSFLYLHEKRPNANKSNIDIQTLPGFIVEQFVEGEELRSLFESAGFDAVC